MINETLTHLKECYDKQTLIIKESEKHWYNILFGNHK